MPASAHRLSQQVLETRLTLLAEMLDRAVHDLDTIIADVRSHDQDMGRDAGPPEGECDE